MEEQTQYYILETSPVKEFVSTPPPVKYIVEGSSIPKSFQRATSILSGRTVTQFNQITTGNTGDDPSRGIGYAAGVAFGRNVLGNTSVVPRLIVMPDEEAQQVDVAGEVVLDSDAAAGQTIMSNQGTDVTTGEDVNIIIIAQNEETDGEHSIHGNLNNKENQTSITVQQPMELGQTLNDFPEVKKKSQEKRRTFDPSMKPHHCPVCQNRSYTARKDLYRHIRKEHPSEAQEMINKIRQEWKDDRHRNRQSLVTDENAVFSIDCVECGKVAEPSQRDKYLCRCLSCDLMFRVTDIQEETDELDNNLTLQQGKHEITILSSEEVAQTDTTWWEESTPPDTDPPDGADDINMSDADRDSLVGISADGDEAAQDTSVKQMRFHGKGRKKLQHQIHKAKQNTRTDTLEKITPKKKPSPLEASPAKKISRESEVGVRRSSRANKGINRKYEEAVVKVENIDEEREDDEDEYVPEPEDVKDDEVEEVEDLAQDSDEAEDEPAIAPEKKETEGSPRKGRRGFFGRRRCKRFPCTQCDKVFRSAQGLRNHARGHTGYKKKYRPPPATECEKCGAKISTFQGYQNHMRIHQFDDKSYVCDVCDKRFTSLDKFEEHEMLHEDSTYSGSTTDPDGDYPFRCKLCVHRLYKYKMRSQLYRHFRVRHPAAASSLMEEEMRIRRISKAMTIMKENEMFKSSVKDEEEEPGTTDSMETTIIVTLPTGEDGTNTEENSIVLENAEDEHVSEETHVLIDISEILACAGKEITGENATGAEKSATEDNDMEVTNEAIQIEDNDASNKCLSCHKTFADQESLCKHAISCSIQLQKYVQRMEKRREEAKRYSRKGLELPATSKIELTCGTCDVKFKARDKLGYHIMEAHPGRAMNDCQVCGQDFETNEELQDHIKIHPEYEQQNLLCAKCGKSFANQATYQAHQHKLCGPSEQCDQCGRIFKFAATLEKHKKRIHAEKDYYVDDNSKVLQEAQTRDKATCSVCNEKFVDAVTAKAHLKSAHTEEEIQKPFQCPQCGNRFRRYPELIHHKLIHAGEKPYKCKFCNKGFRSISSLTQHKYRHTSTKKFKCSICDAQFIKLFALKVHLARHSTQINCPACPRTFQSQENFEEHYRIHTGERPFKCKYCGEGFTSQRYVNRHMSVKHSDVEVTVRTTQYTCDVPDCNFSCTHISTLRYHKLRHTGEKPYQCDICQKAFRSSSRLKEHKRMHSGLRPYKCQYCEDFFPTSTAVRRHERRHVQTNNYNKMARRSTSKGPHICEWCNKVFKKKNDHTKHIRVHTGELPYQCKFCLRKFRTNSAWRRHEREHTGEAPKLVGDCMCNECGKRVAKNQITAHMQLHRGDTPFLCDFCEETFATKQALSGHHRKAHGKEKTVYQCTLCCENFKDHTKWKHHTMLHSGEKPEKCDVCGKCFRLKKELKRHMLGHSDPQHICPFCKKAVRTPSQLKHHIRTHTGEKPHRCEECNRTFNQSYALKRHMMTHTDEKPHVCEECDSAYKTLDALQRHQRKKHGFVSATKRFPCPLCDREFLSAWHLDEHIKFHAGTRPHKCNYCDRTFNSKLDLENHVPLHTGQLKYECEECGRGFKTEVECAEHLSSHADDSKTFQCKFCNEVYATNGLLRRHVESHITIQDGQVYVVGSSQPTTVYEIVTEPEQTIVETTPMEIVEGQTS